LCGLLDGGDRGVAGLPLIRVRSSIARRFDAVTQETPIAGSRALNAAPARPPGSPPRRSTPQARPQGVRFQPAQLGAVSTGLDTSGLGTGR
jgi:hypothetical protein